MTEVESGSLFVHAMFNLLLAGSDTLFTLHVFWLVKVIEKEHPSLAVQGRFALYPWLIVLPMHAIYCVWTFVSIILLLCGCQR